MGLTYVLFKMMTGIVIFLLGAGFLEESIKSLAGRSFKLFLKKQTSNKLKAIGGGTIVTGVLQSSSVVSLMVLAFVGAGIIEMQNALAVILGANLGTTIDSWVVATLGFKFNIETIAYPVAGFAGIAMLLSNTGSRFYHWSRLLLGFAFLFVGLNFIKTGMVDVIKQIDLGRINEQPAIVFLFTGLLITAIIQSSSATVVIVLSALYTNAIGLLQATAIILGAEIGSSLKLILASAKGSADKKRVTLGIIIFNSTSVILMFMVLAPVNRLITNTIGIHDNLIALVFFQSLLNIGAIILFYPLLGPMGRFLEKRFAKNEEQTLFIHKVKVSETESAMVALEKEAVSMLYHAVVFSLETFDKRLSAAGELKLEADFETKKSMEKYEYIKHLHGNIYSYASALQGLVTDRETTNRLHQLIDAARNTMYAAKNIKDAIPDIEQLMKSSKDQKYDYYLRTGERIKEFFENIISLLADRNQENLYQGIHSIYKKIQESYQEMLTALHKEELHKGLDEIEFSTIVNFNREIYTCEKSVVFAVKDLLLNEEEAARFDELPGFIR